MLEWIAMAALGASVVTDKTELPEPVYESGIRRAEKLADRLRVARPGLLEGLGVVSDSELAQQFGLSRERIRQYRRILSFQARYQSR